MNTHKHNRRIGGIKPAHPLTCPDLWPQAWTYASRMRGAHTGTTGTGRDLSGGLADLAQAITDRRAVELADALAGGWQSWEICARFGCDLCPGCVERGCDECGDGGQVAA